MKKFGFCALALILSLQAGVFAIEENFDPVYLEPEEETTTFFSKIKKNEIYTLSNFKESSIGASADVDVVTREDIERQNTPSLTTLLNNLGAITTNNTNGSDGSVTSFRLRGTDRVRMTIDGVRVDRPSLTSPGAEIQHILADDLERIEVIKGPQGNVSGTNASGGVVSMQTRRGEGPFKLELSSDMGNYSTFKERFAVMGSNEVVDFYLSATGYSTNGGLTTTNLGRMENDFYKNFSIVNNMGVKLFDNHAELRNVFRASNAKKGTPVNSDRFYNYYNDPNDYLRNIDIMENLSYTHAVNDVYDYDLRFGLYHNKSKNHSFEDVFEPEGYNRSNIDSTRLNFMTQHNVKVADWNTLSLGYNLERESIDGDSDVNSLDWMTFSMKRYLGEYSGSTVQNDVFLNDVVNIKDVFFLRGGARLSHNSDYGTYVSPNASAALVLPTFKIDGAKTKLRGSWGMSKNTPTLYQRYAGYDMGWVIQDANPNLKEEQFQSFDAGVEQSFFDEKLSFDFGWFKSDYKDYINWMYSDDYTHAWYTNVDRAILQGFEGKVSFEPNDKFKLLLNYTYTDTENKLTGTPLASVPKNRYNGTLIYTPFERWNMYAGIEVASSRFTAEPVSASNKAKGYVDARIGTSLRLFSFKELRTYLKANIYNLFNQDICMYHPGGDVYYYGPKLRYNIGMFFEFGGKKKDKEKDRV